MAADRSLPPQALGPHIEGRAVYTADGVSLGTVKEWHGDTFKVNAPFEPDFWLAASGIASVEPDRVQLSFPQERLDDFKRDGDEQPAHD